jgi:ATP-dependent Clp endopeptidase proteolytic subunit ClpP
MKRSNQRHMQVPTALLAEVEEKRAPRPQPVNLDGRDEGKSWFRIENKADSTADVYLYEEIGYWGVSAREFVQQIRNLDVEQINMHIHSPGGEIFDGVAIYNALIQHKANVTVFIDGLAASAASFIAQAGDEIFISPSATVMIHDGAAVVWGNEADMRATADLLGKLSNTIAEIYANRAGGTTEEWRALMREETWYNAKEAVEAGLADKVSDTGDGDTATNRWDLSLFNFAGRDQAPSPDRVRVSIQNKMKENDVVPAKNEAESVDGQEAVEPTVPTQPSAPSAESSEEPAEETVELSPAPAAPENRSAAQGVLINGALVTDFGAIQAHVNKLETFVAETKAVARTSFVDSLAKDKKIVPAQADSFKSSTDSSRPRGTRPRLSPCCRCTARRRPREVRSTRCALGSPTSRRSSLTTRTVG